VTDRHPAFALAQAMFERCVRLANGRPRWNVAQRTHL